MAWSDGERNNLSFENNLSYGFVKSQAKEHTWHVRPVRLIRCLVFRIATYQYTCTCTRLLQAWTSSKHPCSEAYCTVQHGAGAPSMTRICAGAAKKPNHDLSVADGLMGLINLAAFSQYPSLDPVFVALVGAPERIPPPSKTQHRAERLSIHANPGPPHGLT